MVAAGMKKPQMSAVQKEIEILLIAQARAVVTPYVDHDGSSLKSCSNYSSQPTAYGGGWTQGVSSTEKPL